MKYSQKASVLIYTLVLVVLTVFMATGVLNMAQKFSLDHNIRVLDNSLVTEIREKKDIIVKYANFLNSNGWWFRDNIWCPQSITMSGNTIGPETFSMNYIYTWWVMSCTGKYNNSDVYVYFNSGFTDTYSLKYNWYLLTLNSLHTSGILWDSDQTVVDAGTSYPLVSDGIDDNFNSDNYSVTSTGTIAYATWYTDDDADMRREHIWYITDNWKWYNMFWLNNDIRKYVSENTNNTWGLIWRIWETNVWYLLLDMDKAFSLRLYELNSKSYSDFNEMRVINMHENTTTSQAGKWYLQNNMTLSPNITGSEYQFDFANHDYALFANNHGSWTLLYRVSATDAFWTPLYSVPLKDDEPGFLTYLSSHIILDSSQKLIAKISKLVSFKSTYIYTPPSNGMLAWFDASDNSTIVQTWSYISELHDKSWNALHLSQTLTSYQPQTWISSLNWLNTIHFSGDYMNLSRTQSYRTVIFVVNNANGSDDTASVMPIIGQSKSNWSDYIFLKTNSAANDYDISVDGHKINNTGTAYYGGWVWVSGGDINLWLDNNTDISWPSIWVVVMSASVPADFIWQLLSDRYFKANMEFWEMFLYDTVLSNSEINGIWNYLSQKWGVSWTDI